MLVLSRKPGEKIVIAGNITVEVLEIQGNRIRVGITAPIDVPIVRSELMDESGQDPSADNPSSDPV